MTTLVLKRLLIFVSLPIISWSGHITYDSVRDTGNLDSGLLAAFPADAAGWSSTYYEGVTIRLASRMIADDAAEACGRPIARCDTGNLPHDESGTYLIKLLDLNQDSGSNTSAAVLNLTADRRRRLLAMDRGANYVMQFVNGADPPVVTLHSIGRMDGSGVEIMKLNAPASQWLRISQNDREPTVMDLFVWNRPMGEPLALCLMGLLWISPAVLHRRGEIGGRRHGRRRRSHPGRARGAT